MFKLIEALFHAIDTNDKQSIGVAKYLLGAVAISEYSTSKTIAAQHYHALACAHYYK